MPERRLITDRLLQSLPPANEGTRVVIWDTREPGFGLRVSDRKDPNPQRRGKAGKITFLPMHVSYPTPARADARSATLVRSALMRRAARQATGRT